MSSEESLDRKGDLQRQLNGMQEQLQLATQMLVRHQMVIDILTKGQGLRMKVKPGFESQITDFPVPDDSPLYRLAPTHVPEPSKILTN